MNVLGGWSWWILGLILLAVEVVAPGFFFLWFGIAAILIGTSALLIEWPWQLQVIGFLVLSELAALLAGGSSAHRHRDERPEPEPASQSASGTHLRAVGGNPRGAGRVRIDETVWQVRGPDAPAGTRVTVTGADGPVLNVEIA
jgi:membrane protein implicated in regulation of membrane protease activity